jgi:hypothetical protein
MRLGLRRQRRRGLGATEWVIVVAGIGLICVVLVGVMGLRVSDDMDATAEDVGNPAALTERFE